MIYIVFGCGSPMRVSANSSEHAEMIVVDTYGARIEDLVTMKESDAIGMLH